MARDLWTGGNEAAGFEVRVDRIKRVLRFTFWGFWDEPLARQYLAASIAGMRELRATDGPWHVLADLTRYPAQKEEVGKCHGESMKAGHELGLSRAANLVSSSLSAMQIRRLSIENNLPEFSFFQDERLALAWLETGEQKPK
ncbi:MAG: hypothetical protein U0414_35435 [Polyangiaceae bacterium]